MVRIDGGGMGKRGRGGEGGVVTSSTHACVVVSARGISPHALNQIYSPHERVAAHSHPLYAGQWNADPGTAMSEGTRSSVIAGQGQSARCAARR